MPALLSRPDEHYQTMKQKDIEDLQIPSADNSILFLWATFPKLPEVIAVMKAWGYKYKTGAVWVKDKIETGYYFRGQSDFY
jgi:N6-adenosine-specific RNA methylase IME4